SEDSILGFDVANPLGGGMLRTVAVLPQGAAERMLQGKPYITRASAAPDTFMKAMHRLLEAADDSSKLGIRSTIEPTDTLRVEVPRQPTGRPASLQISVWRKGRLSIQYNTAHVSTFLLDESTGDPSRPEKLLREAAAHPELRRPMAEQPPLKWPEPPAPQPSYIGWRLRDLARRLPYPIVADCYPAAEEENLITRSDGRPRPSPQTDGVTPVSALESLCDPTAYDWRIQDGWLMLRYRHWFWEAVRPVEAGGEKQGTGERTEG
ncbi:MAG TPA: hypothetical protein VFU47_01100, partial [Armatimonadota bacterium]|nr:hypothetical protein [Armatimonadota bacterium]